jgi:hypothetical protein
MVRRSRSRSRRSRTRKQRGGAIDLGELMNTYKNLMDSDKKLLLQKLSIKTIGDYIFPDKLKIAKPPVEPTKTGNFNTNIQLRTNYKLELGNWVKSIPDPTEFKPYTGLIMGPPTKSNLALR